MTFLTSLTFRVSHWAVYNVFSYECVSNHLYLMNGMQSSSLPQWALYWCMSVSVFVFGCTLYNEDDLHLAKRFGKFPREVEIKMLINNNKHWKCAAIRVNFYKSYGCAADPVDNELKFVWVTLNLYVPRINNNVLWNITNLYIGNILRAQTRDS